MRMLGVGRSARGLAALLVAVVGLLAPSLTGVGPVLAEESEGGHLLIDVLSNRADLVSGGDALVQVRLPSRTNPGSVRVALNGHDVTQSFAVRGDGRFLGLVSGLELGRNHLTADAPSVEGAQITITDYPIDGPIFSGPQVQAGLCNNVAEGRPPPHDRQGDSPAQVRVD